MLRHLFNVVTPRLLGPGVLFPYHTLTVNILRSFLIGVLAGSFAFRGDVSQSWRLFLTTGVLGGFTTFSAFSLDAALLYERGAMISAALYVLASVGVSIAAVFIGLAIVRSSV